MYTIKKEIKGPYQYPRFVLISNYDKLLHVACTFLYLAFLWKINPTLAILSTVFCQISKEVIDYICGDRGWDIIGDLIADCLGWCVFFLWKVM